MGWTHLENENGEIIGIVGDEAWDIMSEAIDKIKKLYNDIEGRDPNAHEMLQIYEFVGGLLPNEQLKAEVAALRAAGEGLAEIHEFELRGIAVMDEVREQRLERWREVAGE